ncbi:MAG: hypothetical protein ACR2IV_20465 [Bryobacteraceae bacterium]
MSDTGIVICLAVLCAAFYGALGYGLYRVIRSIRTLGWTIWYKEHGSTWIPWILIGLAMAGITRVLHK